MPAGPGIPPGADPRRLAATVGADPQDRGRGADAAGRDGDRSRRSAGSAASSPGRSSSPRFATRPAKRVPALVAQQFGKGHVGALLIGDLWRWGLRRRRHGGETTSIARGDRPSAGSWATSPAGSRSRSARRPRRAAPAVEVSVRVRDAEYRPLDNAKVALKLTLPGRQRSPHARRRARRPRGGRLRGDVRPASSPAPIASSPRRPLPTAAPSASAKPAGPPSPPPTSSPGSSPTASS